MNEIKFALLTETAIAPNRKHTNDAGIDLYVDLDADYLELFPGDIEVFHTGVTVEIPPGFFGWITNKSKSNFIIGGGIVDEGYQGELLVKVINPTNKYMQINRGQAIAQLLIIPCITPLVVIVDPENIHKEPTARKDTGGIWDGFIQDTTTSFPDGVYVEKFFSIYGDDDEELLYDED